MSGLRAVRRFVLERLQQSAASSTPPPIILSGLTETQWPFVQNYLQLAPTPANQLWVFSSPENAEHHYQQLKPIMDKPALYYPGLDASPYGGHIHSEQALFQRFAVLQTLAQQTQPTAVFTSWDAAHLLGPGTQFFPDHTIKLAVSDILPPEALTRRLAQGGYRPAISVEEAGTFCTKGEIVDIYPLHPAGYPIRIYYYDQMIEEIFPIDPATQRTDRQRPLERITLAPCPHIFTTPPFPTTLRSQLPQPRDRAKKLARDHILARLREGHLFESYSVYSPLFTPQQATLLDYFNPQKDLIHLCEPHKCQEQFKQLSATLATDYQRIRTDPNSPCILPEPTRLYRLDQQWKQFKQLCTHALDTQQQSNNHHFHLTVEKPLVSLKKNFPHAFSQPGKLKPTLQALIKRAQERRTNVIVYSHPHTPAKITQLWELNAPEGADLPSLPEFIFGHLEQGLYCFTDDLLIISEHDFFSAPTRSLSPPERKSRPDLFAEQMASLKVGDYVIHKNYGIGVYRGLQTLNIGATSGDFLTIHYQGEDKVYVPVYRTHLVQKYADQSSPSKVASLKNNKFDQLKKRAKTAAKKLAFDLLEIQAKRATQQPQPFSPPGEIYQEFARQFPFTATPDQETAIQDVLADMQRPQPMDRLVCGDVGFGKTEVAMRAACKAIEDGRQVAILVPTTILALQHFHSFQARFQDFPAEIAFLSRFLSSQATKKVLEQTQSGALDIVIGTHKLLSGQISFKNLGLLIIDEEQRFGVGHKEKIKALKSSLDILTLTATPIPRTLQLAFLGIRDLSLIQTPPPQRQSIKTYLVKYDEETIRQAIEYELQRGGQIFYVHNRVRSIEAVAENIRHLVPGIQMAVAHGQIPERKLQQIMSDFYSGKYRLLLASTIIESGLDIPSANTMIIDQANSYGLSQLHQLRGRTGRSERKAYAYFLIPPNCQLTATATRRLQALQTYSDVGAGFSLASCDLEIRGVGDLLGAEQSGHLETVGAETYMELLQQAIAELKGEQSPPPRDIEMQTSFRCFIPNSYISDPGERLKTYKRLSNAKSSGTLGSIREELAERFGLLPPELEQLLELLAIRLLLEPLGVEKLTLSGKVVGLKFCTKYLDSQPAYRDKMINFFTSRPRQYRFGPNDSITREFQSVVSLEKLAQFTQEIAQQIIPC